jgi:molecular chaperone GrpE
VSKKFQDKAAESAAAEENEEASEVDNSEENSADADLDSAGQADDASDADEPQEGTKPSDQRDAVIADLRDQVKRQMAEFDNFRKRTDKEKSAMFEMGASDVIKKLLPVVDNFERGFKSLTDDEKETPFAKGMDMVYKQTLKMLDELNVKPIEAVGQEFNPELHNAVMHVEDESAGENIIIEEFEKGYTYRETVIRHSMVKVAN